MTVKVSELQGAALDRAVAECDVNELQTCQVDAEGLSLRDCDAISEIVHDALRDMGIEPASFSWCIEVEYTEEKENCNE